MDVKELRIGNYVIYEKTTHIITALNKKMCSSEWIEGKTYYDYTHSYNDIKPIPLTEDWLLKFGFEEIKISNSDDGYLYSDYQLETENNVLIWFSLRKELMDYKHVKHVHQLQNLYFALTGEELTIK